MFARTVEILVHRPIAQVFDFIEDARNRPQWDDTVVSEQLTSPEPIGVGTTVRTPRTRGPWNSETRVRFTVTGRPTGLMLLLQPLLARSTQGNLERNFPRLKQLLETGTSPTSPER